MCIVYFKYMLHCLYLIQIHAYSFNYHENFETAPFVAIWNAPTYKCTHKFGIPLNLSDYDIVANTGSKFAGDEIVIFYTLGLFPWIRDDGTYMNGGLPQLGNVQQHLDKVKDDISERIPDTNFSGLGVIDWERWRPIFDRNNYNHVMRVYIRASENIVREKHPDWSADKVENEARREFEAAAKEFMQETIELCRHLRPRAVWGYYGFPNCHNDELGEKHCASRTMDYNNELKWLFNESTVILPSVYLKEAFGSHQDRYDRVYGELQETLRVKTRFDGPSMPLIAYSRFTYGDSQKYYDTTDLDSTIRQIAEAGLTGVALWGASASFRTRYQCEATREYLKSILGPFVKNVTRAAYECSKSLCNSHGRCFKRQTWFPNDAEIQTDDGERVGQEPGMLDRINSFITRCVKNLSKLMVLVLANRDIYNDHADIITYKYSQEENCWCFKGWTGKFCEQHA